VSLNGNTMKKKYLLLGRLSTFIILGLIVIVSILALSNRAIKITRPINENTLPDSIVIIYTNFYHTSIYTIHYFDFEGYFFSDLHKLKITNKRRIALLMNELEDSCTTRLLEQVDTRANIYVFYGQERDIYNMDLFRLEKPDNKVYRLSDSSFKLLIRLGVIEKNASRVF